MASTSCGMSHATSKTKGGGIYSPRPDVNCFTIFQHFPPLNALWVRNEEYCKSLIRVYFQLRYEVGFEETSFASSSQIRFLGWAFLLASPPNWFISRTDCRSRTQTRPSSQGRFSFLAVEEIWPNLYVRIWSVLNCRQMSMRGLLFCLSLRKVSIDVLSQSLA